MLIPVCFSLASMAQHHEHGHPHADTVGNVSNQQMHRSSTADLIARFAVAENEQGWTAASNDKDSSGRDDG